MRLAPGKMDFQYKSRLAEFSYLVFISVISPLAVGLQIFDSNGFIGSLVLLNVLSVPAIVLFYRVYLPLTVGKKRYVLALFIFPVYFFVYELNARLAALALININFIPDSYRKNLASVNPQDFSQGWFVQSIGYTCLVLLGATSIYILKQLLDKQQKLLTLATEKLQLELTHLKSQIQPHFFFNTLNNLYSLSIQGSPSTPVVIKDLSTIMRYVLYETSQEKVSLQQEIDLIKSYIHLENIRHKDNEMIDFSIQGNIDHVKIEPLLFLPLIENTFKHSIAPDVDMKWVKIVLAVDEDEIVFQTTNPKNTIGSSSSNGLNGIGLNNVRKRLQLLYPAKHELVTQEAEGNFIATLTIART